MRKANTPHMIAMISKAQSGDKEALDHVVLTHYRLVQHHAHKMQPHRAEGATQDGCVGLLRAIARYNPSAHSIWECYASSWIRYQIRSKYRYEKQRALARTIPLHCGPRQDNYGPADNVGSGDPTGRIIAAIALKKATPLLDVRKRAIIRRRYMLGETKAEVARAFAISAKRIAQIEQKALGILKKCIATKM